jgi:hypothetical protein
LQAVEEAADDGGGAGFEGFEGGLVERGGHWCLSAGDVGREGCYGGRPSHADRRKALQRLCLGQEFLQLMEGRTLAPEIQQFVGRVINHAA